jgi:cell division GTPase FtsZ
MHIYCYCWLNVSVCVLAGKTRAVEAARAAISSPLLDFPIEKAKSLIFNVVGSTDMTLQEVQYVCVSVCEW